jgi:DNA-binding IclR family transcriptional regulator
MSQHEQLDGNTLNVYLYFAKKRKPQGPRDVMRAMNLSSPSVAYRHLQKLEAQGLLQRNEYGEYTLKKKAHINGFHWIGKTLFPRTMFYFVFFIALLVTEAIVLAIHWQWEDWVIKNVLRYRHVYNGYRSRLFPLGSHNCPKKTTQK